MSDAGFDLTKNSKFKTQNCIKVSAGLVFRNGLLLITQRRAKDHLGGLWEFPGGKREGNESDQECLVRELREELGIEVQVGELVESIQHNYPEKLILLKFFRCVLKNGQPSPLACDAVAWVNSAEIANYAFPEADQRLLGKLRASPDLWRK